MHIYLHVRIYYTIWLEMWISPATGSMTRLGKKDVVFKRRENPKPHEEKHAVVRAMMQNNKTIYTGYIRLYMYKSID